MARLEERVEHLVDLSERTLDQTTRTNGRVTALEAWRIQEEARRSERRSIASQAAQTAAERAARAARRVGVVMPVSCVVLGATLGRVIQLI